ncbi:MAG TPA: cation transporter [Egibacteraceae bacterium]|nr:cation transporter [Egibacteraceae bacterium]
MPNETISVPEIHCDHCKQSIEGALNPLPGVDLATVDVAQRTVTVEYDQSSISRDDIVGAIQDQGYEVPA